ncbi:hypothetical protein I302_108809 [Kwoniella bestiolae CBS 10118]|uniref:SnoaL-like domain-containing protein n=1 Tax=Kwoniella bestiolae CBS 10118 TaxID=1296100 RepID=A0A1B9FU53_9TREE|nr:hypothetical protein I302_07947 [Kwoniella bestiolae CBS 10118]OCF22301.1 hypothetical protein I302_07947 [Kwoniella bestiolae CBS 10118]
MPAISSNQDLISHYRSYISSINSLPNSTLNPYLADQINHNDRLLSPEEYHKLIIPGSIFRIVDVLASVEDRRIGARLEIELGDGSGRVVREHVFYKLGEGWGIERVWSMVEGL